MEDDAPGTPGTPLGRLAAIQAFAEARLGHSPISSRPAEVVVLETLDRLLKEREAGISYTLSHPLNQARHAQRTA